MTTTPPLGEPPVVPSPANLFGRVVPPIILPVFLSSADATVVATALPAIAASFGEVEHLSWIVIANLVASTVAAPAYGRLGDAFGRRRMMTIALCIFMFASLLCALAPSFGLLLAGRVLQGLGAGGLMTLAQALLGENVPPRQRGSYQGYLSANIVAGATIGPVIAVSSPRPGVGTRCSWPIFRSGRSRSFCWHACRQESEAAGPPDST